MLHVDDATLSIARGLVQSAVCPCGMPAERLTVDLRFRKPNARRVMGQRIRWSTVVPLPADVDAFVTTWCGATDDDHTGGTVIIDAALTEDDM